VPSFEDLHVTPHIAAALERLGWNPQDSAVREIVPATARGNNVVASFPPAPAYATPSLAGALTRLREGARALLLTPASQLDEWGRLAHRLSHDSGIRVQVAHGTARTMRRLKADALDLIIATPETALTLSSRSALQLDAVTTLFLAWPESWEEEESITALMQDLPRETQRVVYTAANDRVDALIDRYARKALPARTQGLESGPTGPIRTVSVPWGRRVAVLSELVELLDPASMAIWTLDRSYHEAISQAVSLTDPELRLVTGDVPETSIIVAFDLPSGERLQQMAGAGEVIVLVPPGTESYVARIANPRRPLLLPGALDAAATRAAGQRAAIVRTIETGNADRALLTLAPLFERHDAASIAAALFDLWSNSVPVESPARVPDIPATAKIYVGVGKKDGATANDLVAVLTKEIRVERGKIGRIELRDAYSLVEIPAQDAEKVAQALNGVTIRRRRVTARVDRGPSRPRREGPAARPARRT
jgi:ATP-dependent RNA helicase DeaD